MSPSKGDHSFSFGEADLYWDQDPPRSDLLLRDPIYLLARAYAYEKRPESNDEVGMPHRDPGNDTGNAWRLAKVGGIFEVMSAPNDSNTNASPNFAPASRLAASLARELERLTSSAPSFDDLEMVITSARALVRQVNACRYKLPGAPSSTTTETTSKPSTKSRRGRATIDGNAPVTTAPSL